MTRYDYLIPCPECGNRKTVSSEKHIYCITCEKNYDRPQNPKYRKYNFW